MTIKPDRWIRILTGTGSRDGKAYFRSQMLKKNGNFNVIMGWLVVLLQRGRRDLGDF